MIAARLAKLKNGERKQAWSIDQAKLPPITQTKAAAHRNVSAPFGREAGLNFGRERVIAVAVARPNSTIGAVDQRFALLVTGNLSRPVSRLGLRVVNLSQALVAVALGSVIEPQSKGLPSAILRAMVAGGRMAAPRHFECLLSCVANKKNENNRLA